MWRIRKTYWITTGLWEKILNNLDWKTSFPNLLSILGQFVQNWNYVFWYSWHLNVWSERTLKQFLNSHWFTESFLLLPSNDFLFLTSLTLNILDSKLSFCLSQCFSFCIEPDTFLPRSRCLLNTYCSFSSGGVYLSPLPPRTLAGYLWRFPEPLVFPLWKILPHVGYLSPGLTRCPAVYQREKGRNKT